MRMRSTLTTLKSGEVKLLFRILKKLSSSQDRVVFRKEISNDLLRLLKSDYLASFIWNQESQVFEDVIMLNMSPGNIKNYERYYQYHDPITPSLQKRRRATLVNQIMPQKELEKTEFFNDFLMKDGLHHGINVYAYDGDLNIGDLRVWRSRNRPNFGKNEADLLNFILPYFRNALRNARALSWARKNDSLFHDLLKKNQHGVVIFDHNDHLVYKNSKARDIDNKLAPDARIALQERIFSTLHRNFSRSEFGPYFLSSLSLPSPHDSKPLTAVLLHSAEPTKVDAVLIQEKFRLTAREAEICLLVCKGLTDQEIASVLDIAFSTVRTHMKHIFAKLDVTTRSEIIHGLLEGLIDFSF